MRVVLQHQYCTPGGSSAIDACPLNGLPAFYGVNMLLRHGMHTLRLEVVGLEGCNLARTVACSPPIAAYMFSAHASLDR